MKVALCLILGLSANLASARPKPSGSRIDCFFKPQVDSTSWETAGLTEAVLDSQGVRIDFAGTGMRSIETTDSDDEYKVEARCTGYVIMHDEKPFKIRDFSYHYESADIDSNDGKIELVSKGFVKNAKNDTDEFEKIWTIKRSALESYEAENDPGKKAKINPFAAKGESKTLCGTDLTLQFEDLRGLSQRKQNQTGKETRIELQHILITFDPC